MSTLFTLDEINKMVPDGDGYMVADKKFGLAVIFESHMELYEPTGEMVPGDARISKLFERMPDGLYREINYAAMREDLKNFFIEKMNVADIAQEVVDTTSPKALLEATRRLKDPEVRRKARATTGCYAFVIPTDTPDAEGEHGKPMKIFLRS